MDSTTANVVLFAFHDAARAAQVVAAARDQTGVRSVAVVGRSTDCEIRIIGGAGDELTDARWLASALAVLDVLSGPLRALAGSPPETEAITLPDSDGGFATFGRLISGGTLVLLVAVCDDSLSAIGLFESPLGAALFRMPADCAIRVSGAALPWPSSGTSISSVVPLPAGLVTCSVPPSASIRSLSPTSPDPWREVGSPDPVVADRQPQDRVVGVEFDVHHGCVRVLGGVGQRFGHHVVRRDLHWLWQPSLGVQVELDR